MVRLKYRSTAIIAVRIVKFFFPQRNTLEVFTEGYSPDLLRKIVYAGANASSFGQARQFLETLSEISISADHVQTLTVRIGKEMASISEKEAVAWKNTEGCKELAGPVATVSIDGGRAQTRAEGQGAGVHDNHWRETKVGCLQVFNTEVSEQDPHPLLPKAFRDKEIVKNLVAGLKGHNKNNGQAPDLKAECSKGKEQSQQLKVKIEEAQENSKHLPEPLERYCVATVASPEEFGNLIYHKVHQENLHQAQRKAFIGDGDRKIWGIYDFYFGRNSGWVPILDFVHAVEYAFSAAKAGSDSELECWGMYLDIITHLWQGRVLKVLRTLDGVIDKFTTPARHNCKSTQERIEKLQTTRNYFRNNYNRMDYPEYRKQGLPISSCHVESLIKQYNLRVKSTEKFWNESSLKGVLHIKSSMLSDDNSWNQFWADRYEFQARSKRHYFQKAA